MSKSKPFGTKASLFLPPAMLRQLHEAFVKKFGREPNAEDPLFFDPDADTPQLDPKLWDAALELMAPLMRPEALHAARVTGRIVTKMNAHNLSDDEIAEWNAAIASYKP